MFKNIAVFMITLFTRLYVREGILLDGKHLHDRIISIWGEVLANKQFNPAYFG